MNVTERARPSYPIATTAVRTGARTVIPDPAPGGDETYVPSDVAAYLAAGYGTWQYGPGLEQTRRLDLMPTGYAAEGATGAARLLNFFTMTDIHITDKETPIQAIFYGFHGGLSSAYSPVMMCTTHVLDAAVQTMNALHAGKPFDFGISLGDAANNTQYNELRWYIDVLDGQEIDPSSGTQDDPPGQSRQEYQQCYRTAGLDPSIPWYQAIGNHDHFWIGTLAINDYLRAYYVGDEILNLGNVFTEHPGVDSRGFYMGSIDGRTPLGDVFGAGPVGDFTEPPRVRAADPRRRSLRRSEWMAEFLETSSNPVGHGFTQENVDAGLACYSFEPRADLPLTVIVLDDTQRDDDEDVGGFGHGYLDQERYDWLVAELDSARDADRLVVIACHIPIGVEAPASPVGWSSLAAVTEDDLVAKLHEYPNLLLWLAGHRHLNTVTAFPSPDPTRPEMGFWQVETSSLRDFPQQFRTIEIVRNDDLTISILAEDMDPAVADGTLAARSRTYAVAAQQLFSNPLATEPSGSANVELLMPLSARWQSVLAGCGTPLD